MGGGGGWWWVVVFDETKDQQGLINYTDQILFMSTDMHKLLAYASTQEDILNQSNKSMYMQSVETYKKILSNPPKEQDPNIISSLVSTCVSNYNLLRTLNYLFLLIG